MSAWRRLILLCAAALLLGVQPAPPAYAADGVEVRRATVFSAEEGYVLTAEIDVKLTPVLEDALHKGVALYFIMDFELVRPRWYWTNDKITTVQQEQRLSYYPLTRQYRVGVGALYQNFSSLQEALSYMSRVYRRLDLEPGALRKDLTYAAQLRLRFDPTKLPKLYMLHSGRDWSLSADWFRWTVQP